MSSNAMQRILDEMVPAKSKKDYENAHHLFMDFCNQETPTEELYMTYFDHLRHQKKYKSTTLWSIYSKLNSHHQASTGRKLQQDYPRITMQLKNYKRGEVLKQAEVFTQQQLLQFLDTPVLNSSQSKSYWLLRKCAASVAFCGGLRCAELKSLQFESFAKTDAGYVVTYHPAKQRQEVKEAHFLIPFNKSNPTQCFASHVTCYIELAKLSLGTPTGDFFRTCLKGGGFSRLPMGINYLYAIPKTIAETLSLPNPEKFTGHSFRRSSATHLADAGASSVDLRRQFNWKDDQTANRYIINSKSRNTHVAKMIQQNVSTSVEATATSSTTVNTATATSSVFHAQSTNIVEAGDKPAEGKSVVINVQAGATFNLHL